MGAAPEIVEDGETGFLVSGPEEMADALSRARTLDRRAIQARARARFSDLRMARDYLAVYREACARSSATPGAPAPVRRRTGDGWTTLAR
jgi:glycosyltransferase involved in cell wall biosynthesis